MTPESSFVDFGDLFTDAVAADLYASLHLPYNPDIFVLEDESPSHDILGLSPSAQVLPFPTSEYLPSFPEIPPNTGVVQDLFHSLQITHGLSNLQPRATLPAIPHNEVTGAEPRSTGLTLTPSGVLPIFSLPTTPSPPHIATLPHNWIKVPQRDYDHGRRQLNFEKSEPISFIVNSRPGINMGDALRKTFTGLDGRDDPVLQEAAGAISCRLLFPGYPANDSCQIHVLGWTRKRLPITRSKLAHEVAKKVDRYLTSVAGVPLDGSVDGRWRVGGGFMRIENMFLLRLVSVSKGSFQPEIWIADPSAPQVLFG